MESLKIAYVTMRFPLPSETFACNDIKKLLEKGHEVEVYCLRGKHKDHDKLLKQRELESLNIHHFFAGSIADFVLWVIFHPIMFFSLFFWNLRHCMMTPKHVFKSLALTPTACMVFKEIQNQNPDVVHLFWGHYSSLSGFLVSKFNPNRVLTQFLGAHDLVTHYPASFDLAERVDALFTHSSSNISSIQKCLNVKRDVNVIFRGAVIDAAQPSRLSKFSDITAPKFITACRLIEEKGVFEVLDAFSKIMLTYPLATLTVAGDGPDKARLQEHVAKLKLSQSVKFLGHVDQALLIKKMAESHIFILLSRYPSERLPNVVKEAMFQECIIFTTRTSGIEELVATEEDGYIVEKDKLSSLSDKIITVLSDNKTMNSIAFSARTKITDQFDVNVCMSDYESVWKEQVNFKQAH